MICEKCKKEHSGSYGSGRFCNSICARGFSTQAKREEINHKVSIKIKKLYDSGNFSAPKFTIEERKNLVQKIKDNWNRKILEEDFEKLSYERLKKRIVLEQNGKCNKCGLNEWLGVPIALELEHKDGNHENNLRNNLECLCPNCHAQSNTWRGRNKQCNSGKISEIQIIEAFLETGNIRQCLIKVGLAAKGGNYGRVKRTLTMNNIEY